MVCFWCGCKSGKWASREDPWSRHARTSPNCRYLILQKGTEFITRVNEEQGAYRETADSDTQVSQLSLSCRH